MNVVKLFVLYLYTWKWLINAVKLKVLFLIHLIIFIGKKRKRKGDATNKKQKKDDYDSLDSENEYDFEDPFLNDDSSDEYQEESDDFSDDDPDWEDSQNDEDTKTLMKEAQRFTRGRKK